MEFAVWIVHVLVAIALVGLVLLQHGKGADMGAAFGSGASGSLFGASGSANFLSRTTAVLATMFFLTSMGLTYFAAKVHAPAVVAPAPTVPATPAPTTAAPAAVVPVESTVPAPAAASGKEKQAPAKQPASSEKSGDIPK